MIGRYDLVFAKAKSALEALAVGAAVILCDYRGLGPMVTCADLDGLRRLNLGLRTLRDLLVPDLILREIGRYDARDAAEVCRRVREEAGLEPALDRLVALYREVIEEHEREGPCDPAGESRAAAVYLREWAGWMPQLKALAADIDGQRARLDLRVRELEEELRQVRDVPREPEPQEDVRGPLLRRTAELEGELQGVRLELDRLAEALQATQLERDHLAEAHQTTRVERDRLAEALQAATGTITWRLREALMRVPGLRTLYWKARRPGARTNQRT